MAFQPLPVSARPTAAPVERQEVITDLQALRGIAHISAVTIAAELGQVSRFPGARELMGYCGAVPSENKHEGESSFALCDRLSRTPDKSQRQLPTDQDYAVSTREYQTDQSSLKNYPDCCWLCPRKRRKSTTTTNP